MLTIRLLKDYEKTQILELGRQIFREEDEIPLLEKALRQCDLQLSFVAVDAPQKNLGDVDAPHYTFGDLDAPETIVGFVLVCEKFTEYYYKFMRSVPNLYEIAFLGVSPKCQGMGIGSKLLMKAMLNIMVISPAYSCWLLVDVDNISALRLYERIGFEIWRKTDKGKTPVPGYILGIRRHRYLTRFNTMDHIKYVL
jgi:ribosomal protein S18 acetylase RimI-like enzyme